MSRSIIRGAGALVVALSIAIGVASAQSPAVNPKEAAQAAAEQKQRIDQPLNNQPVWKEIRSGEPQITTVRGRETNVLIQPEGQTWRAIRVPIATGGRLAARDRRARAHGLLRVARSDRARTASRPAG